MNNLTKKIISFVMDTMETIVFMGSIFVVVYLYLGQPSYVSGASMEPNFHTGDRVITSKISYKLSDMRRGDVIVIHAPSNPEIQYIKRVIALEGESVMVKSGKVYVNEKALEEPYLHDLTPVRPGDFLQEGVPYNVPEGYIFVMGDNRPQSADSREFGPIAETEVVGKAIYRYYPFTQLGLIDNPLVK